MYIFTTFGNSYIVDGNWDSKSILKAILFWLKDIIIIKIKMQSIMVNMTDYYS